MPAYIEGTKELLKKLDNFPGSAKRAMKEAMKAGGKAAAKVQKSINSDRWPELIRYGVHTDALGRMYTNVGYQTRAKRGAKGTGIPNWFKAYWMNYGTLSNRDPAHKFKRHVRRHVSGRRNNVGQTARHFFREGHPSVVQAFSGALEKKFDELIEKEWQK